MPLWAEVGAVGILLVVHAAIAKIMDAKNKNPFVIVTAKRSEGNLSVSGSPWVGMVFPWAFGCGTIARGGTLRVGDSCGALEGLCAAALPLRLCYEMRRQPCGAVNASSTRSGC